MLEVADVFRRYGPEYLDRYGKKMLFSHYRAYRDILGCRTPALGGSLYTCDHCDHQVYSYHSCKNRSCPKCCGGETEIWLEKRQKEMLPVKYFHVVFTIPQELRKHVRSCQKIMYGILMKAAGKSLIKMAADPHYVGGLIGVMAVLHTWDRTLGYHPHVHCLVPAGGVSGDNRWIEARDNYLVPVKALSKMFREFMAKEAPDIIVPETVWSKNWVVYCKPSARNGDAALAYLSRYVHRIAISNSRILSIDDGKVVFSYKNSRTSQWKTMTLDAMEFMRRFLQHVLPRGMHKVRYYGIWNPSNKAVLRSLQITLAQNNPTQSLSAAELPVETVSVVPMENNLICPHCGKGVLTLERIIVKGVKPP